MKVRRVIGGLIVVLILMGCKKEYALNWTGIEIKMTHAVTGEPLNGIPFAIHGTKSSDLYWTADKHEEALTGTLENGHYEGGFKANRRGWKYVLGFGDNFGQIFGENFTDKYDLIDFDPFAFNIEKFKKNKFDIKVVETYDVKFEITNEDCQGYSDELYFVMRHLDFDPSSKLDPDGDAWNLEPHTSFGCESLGSYGRHPAGDYQASLRITRNGNVHYEKRFFTVEPNDDNIIQVTF